MRTIDRIDQLIDRLNQNLSDYKDSLMGFDRSQIIEMAGRIHAMQDAHFYLTEHHAFDYDQADYLLQFQNPLEVVADKWQERTDDISDMSFVLHDVFDKQDALHDYPLVTDAAPSKTYLQKFENVDVLATLKAIANQKIVYYPNDINIDMEFIKKYADGDNPEKKMLMWHVGSTGTHHLPERDVFVSGTGAYDYWQDYVHPDRLGYAVEISGMENGKVMGNVYELAYKEHMEHVRQTALPATTVTINYEDGRDDTVTRRVYDDDRHRLMSESGRVTSLRFHPEDESVLASVLRREQNQRQQTPKGNFKAHIKTLHDNRVNAEAQRIVEAFGELSEPNSPNKTHFMVPLSHEFQFLASTKDHDRLFDALKYKTMNLTNITGEKGIFVTVTKDEILKQRDAQKPSVLKQLAAASKEAAARPPAPTQDKKHDKEAR